MCKVVVGFVDNPVPPQQKEREGWLAAVCTEKVHLGARGTNNNIEQMIRRPKKGSFPWVLKWIQWVI
jgi:hypothetical protein